MTILISGYKRSGKDYISDILVKALDAEKHSFASPIKDIIATTLNITQPLLDELKNDESALFVHNGLHHIAITDFRSILQVFGTEAMKKHFGDDVWANLLASKLDTTKLNIVSDWRFVSEYDVLNEIDDVVTVRVITDDINTDMHPSETGLDGFKFDAVIDNSAKGEVDLTPILKLIA